MHECVILCVYVYMCAGTHSGLSEGVGSHGFRVTGICELPNMVLDVIL